MHSTIIFSFIIRNVLKSFLASFISLIFVFRLLVKISFDPNLIKERFQNNLILQHLDWWFHFENVLNLRHEVWLLITLVLMISSTVFLTLKMYGFEAFTVQLLQSNSHE